MDIVIARRQRTALLLALVISITIAGCGQAQQAAPATIIAPSPTAALGATSPLYEDATQPLDARVNDLLARMTLDEKIGQMTQVENNSITPQEVTKYSISSVLTGGDGISRTNLLPDWIAKVKSYQDAALKTRLGIPLIYGIDSVHGMAHVNGATVFPHNIGLGATRDAELVRKIGQATAEEMLAAGTPWNFAPVVAVPQDIRWGRTYEGFSEDTALVTELSTAYLLGFQEGIAAPSGQTLHALATAKHYIGDGGTTFRTSTRNLFKPWLLDQGDMRLDEAAVRSLFLPPYESAVDNGVLSVMVSFSSWNGTKMHGNQHAITDMLKGELGFGGFVVSDWGGIDQINSDYSKAVISAINAGVDMNMVPQNYRRFIDVMKQAVASGAISQERIDDAVRRILRAKMALGLFEHPYGDPSLADTVGSVEHHALARQAVRESLVLLKNDNGALPIAKDTPSIFVAGSNADSVGSQLGGWSLTWQGSTTANVMGGTSILEGIKKAVTPDTAVTYEQTAQFTGRADFGVVVAGEAPYAEGEGDTADLTLAWQDIAAISRMRERVDKLTVVIVSGRPMVIKDQFQSADAWVAAWLPGTEGEGVSDVLFGDAPFTGKLPYTWPRSNAQLPINENNAAGKTGCAAPLFPLGYGSGEAGSQAIESIDCP